MAIRFENRFQAAGPIEILDIAQIQKEFDEAIKERQFARASELLQIPQRAIDLHPTWSSVVSMRHPDGEAAKIEILSFLIQAKMKYGEDNDDSTGRIHMHSRDALGMTALHHAACLGEAEVFKWLLQLRQPHPLLHHSQGSIEWTRRDHNGYAPIHYAALNEEHGIDMMQSYLTATGECEFTTEKLETALSLCCKKGLFTHAEFLLSYTITLGQKDREGKSAFAYALIQAMQRSPNREEFYRWLPRWLPRLHLNHPISGDDPPLLFIAKNKPLDDGSDPFSFSRFCKLMIDQHNASLLGQDVQGNTALHIAAKRNDLDFVKELQTTSTFHEASKKLNGEGKTAHQLATEQGFDAIRDLLTPSF